MYPIQSGNPWMVQQVVSGTGVFDGTEYGRAKGQIPNGDPNAVIRMSARLYGTAPNAYLIQLIDPGVGVTYPSTTLTQVGNLIAVTLRRDSIAGILATANEVAQVINQANTGIIAVGNGTGNGVVGPYGPALMNNVTPGVDPAIVGPETNQFLWYHPVNTNGGFFYFEQYLETIVIRQFECKFTVPAGTFTVTVSRVNLNSNNEPILAEAVPVFVWENLTTARPDIAVADIGIILHPRQAAMVTTNGGGLSGLVRMDARKSARYPYL